MDKKKRKKKRSAASRKRKPKKRARKKSAKAPVYSFKIAAMKLCKRGAQVATRAGAVAWLARSFPAVAGRRNRNAAGLMRL